jgi:hypothetical protein
MGRDVSRHYSKQDSAATSDEIDYDDYYHGDLWEFCHANFPKSALGPADFWGDSDSDEEHGKMGKSTYVWRNFMDCLDGDKEHYPVLDERGNMMGLNSVPKPSTLPAAMYK